MTTTKCISLYTSVDTTVWLNGKEKSCLKSLKKLLKHDWNSCSFHFEYEIENDPNSFYFISILIYFGSAQLGKERRCILSDPPTFISGSEIVEIVTTALTIATFITKLKSIAVIWTTWHKIFYKKMQWQRSS